jgi:FAD/FMN-containing dehydrogenase
MVRAIEDLALRHAVAIARMAHAGDGKLHLLIISPWNDEGGKLAVQAMKLDVKRTLDPLNIFNPGKAGGPA